jgi:hypothetical protein
VRPLLIAGVASPHVADGENGWFAREEWTALGLPAPVRKLLEAVFEDQKWQEPCIV